MQIVLTIFFIFSFVASSGQRIEYSNDSLFINGMHINAQTSKNTIDKILNEVGRVRNAKSSFRTRSVTGKKVREKTSYYLSNGLYFSWYNDDITSFSIAMRLYPYKFSTDEANRGIPGKLFKGQLFIGDNYINDKRGVAELQLLQGLKVTFTEAEFGASNNRKVMGGEIVYRQSMIKLSFDPSTEKLTTVYIHHNFKHR